MLFDLALQMKCIKSLKGIAFNCWPYVMHAPNANYQPTVLNGLRTLVQRRHALGIIDLFVKFPGT